jgi:hypothetical protein
MINSLVRAMGIACALMTIHFITPVTAAPLTLAPTAQSAPKAKAAVAKVTRERRAPNRMPTWNTYTMGNADLAFLSAGQYLDLSTTEEDIQVVSADELSPLDLAAGNVRFVSPDEVNEIDLAHEPAVLLAQQTANHEASSASAPEMSAAPAAGETSEEDDGVLNRILMTFAGALAMAGAMRVFLA